jgi:hypothetical protein
MESPGTSSAGVRKSTDARSESAEAARQGVESSR